VIDKEELQILNDFLCRVSLLQHRQWLRWPHATARPAIHKSLVAAL
jgi:hypothetical protein